MREIIKNLYVGKVSEAVNSDWQLVNLSAIRHKFMHGWYAKADKNSPYYIIHEAEKYISLNWVDGPAVYFNYQGRGIENVRKVLDFIDSSLQQEKKVLVFCDQGKSRSPSIVLVYLALNGYIINSGYYHAKKDFIQKYYSIYDPGVGIQEFLAVNWKDLMA